jgi:hypothetical protein
MECPPTQVDFDTSSVAEVEIKLISTQQLTLEESACLKKILIKHVLEEELTIFGRCPEIQNLDDNTVFLKHLYHRLLLEFPPFKKREGFTVLKLKNLLVSDFTNFTYNFEASYPKIVSLSRTATKKDVAGYKQLGNLFDMVIRTTKEAEALSKTKVEVSLFPLFPAHL